jgi:hypothetical protein
MPCRVVQATDAPEIHSRPPRYADTVSGISKRGTILASIAIVLVAVGIWWAVSRQPSAMNSNPLPTPVATASIAPAEVKALVTALNSDDPAVARGALAIPSTQTLDPALEAGLRTLRPIVIDEESLHPYSSGTIEGVAYTGPEEQRKTWHIFLTQADGEWKLAATEAK